eukprot:TRINITY_DN196_c0_g1_i1.p1 TRINITY_DN196_c0_g1~~TRINITY_DN196_c0_g1_i1.p1  ORF type:complete len:171 (+),score=17.86 TRINITY_DN196_c0_g1_i1:62-514(+)
MTTITLTPEHGYCLASCIATGVTLFIIGGRVGGKRAALGVELPYLYADRADAERDPQKKRFNCLQRGHQNLLESYTTQLLLLLIGGIKHPLISAVLGIVYCIGAYSFAVGYEKGPEKRYSGLGGLVRIPLLVGLGTSISTILTLCNVLRI